MSPNPYGTVRPDAPPPSPYELAARSPKARRQRGHRKGVDTRALNKRKADARERREQEQAAPLAQTIGSLYPQLLAAINNHEGTHQ